MKIDSILDQGVGKVNEDSLLIQEKLFGVFDGATSLNKFENNKGETGGLIASKIAKECFLKNNDSLINLAITANEEILSEMIKNNIDISTKLNLWSTSAAVVKINKNNFEWVQIGDSIILVIFKDKTFKLLVKDYDHDEETLVMWEELAKKNVENIREKLFNQIVKTREGMNKVYGILNGEKEMINFLNKGEESLNNVSHILLFTDGFFIPKKTALESDNFKKLVDLFLESGLDLIKEYVRKIERNDPKCHTFPRFKQHDDIAAISIFFD